MCPNCFGQKAFSPESYDTKHNCPMCGNEMKYWCSEEINPKTGKSEINQTTTENLDIKKVVTNQPTVSCPYCKSINTKRINGTERVLSVATLGLFSNKINKSFKCNNCKGTF